MTASPYIRSSTVAELLARERSLRRGLAAPAPVSPAAGEEQTLEEIINDGIRQAVSRHNGNRAAAARELGISRTTLWRYLSRMGEEIS